MYKEYIKDSDTTIKFDKNHYMRHIEILRTRIQANNQIGKLLPVQIQSSRTRSYLFLKRLYNDQFIFPIVTYGAETWNLTKKLALKQRIIQWVEERILLDLIRKE